jgi:hypothetical protein
MKTFETQFAEYEKNNTAKNEINKLQNEVNDKITNTIDSKKITEELANIFGLNKEKVNKLTQNETLALSDNMEVNQDEAALAKMFGKYDELMALNNDYTPVKSYA